MDLIPGSGISPGEGNSNWFQCSCLENSRDTGAWRAVDHWVAETDMTEWHTNTRSHIYFHCCSVAPSCSTLCDPMDCSTPGVPVLHHLPELAQIHVHWVGDAIQPSCPLSSPSPPAFSVSHHQSNFSVTSFCHFILFMGFSRQECWSGLPFFSPEDHIFVRILYQDPSVLGGPTQHGS